MTNDTITVPQIIHKEQRTMSGPTTILQFRYLGHHNHFQPNKLHNTSVNTITIENPKSVQLKPFQSTKILFPVMVLSSLPATSFVYAPERLYRLGLHCIISFIPTNDTFLYITVYNYTNKSIHFKENYLQFYCTTTITCNRTIL
jgi:hypothetical protein